MDDRRHELRREMDSHECKFETDIIEMHGDIKTLLAEFRNMNGSLIRTKAKVEKHEEESVDFRRKVDIMWAGLKIAGVIVGFLLGSGVLWNVIKI